MTELHTKHLSLDSGIQHSRVKDMDSRDMRPEYQTLRRVHSESDNVDYLIGKVSVLDVPFKDADVAADRVEIYVCSCPDYYFNQSDGIETGERKPSECDECKHLLSEVKHLKAQADESQESLF